MVKKKKIGIIGYGTIGSYLFEKIQKDKDLEIDFIFDKDKDKIKDLDKKLDSFKDFNRDIGLVVECASPEAVEQYAPIILNNTNLLIFSVSALSDNKLKENLERICKNNKTKLYIPHGAIIGLDGIYDSRELLENVKITTIKNPKNLGLDNKELEVVYEGPTKKACEKFPRNVNVHAALALVGLGFENTYSKIISDPNSLTNNHIIEAEAKGIKFKIEISSERKGLVTGVYTPESAYQTIKRICIEKDGINIV